MNCPRFFHPGIFLFGLCILQPYQGEAPAVRYLRKGKERCTMGFLCHQKKCRLARRTR